jgi:hypothetical protein
MTPDLSNEALDALLRDLDDEAGLPWIDRAAAAIRGLREQLKGRTEWINAVKEQRDRAERAEAELAKRHEDEHGGPCPWERERDSLLAERDRLRERLKEEMDRGSHLAAYQCAEPYGNESGYMQCRMVDRERERVAISEQNTRNVEKYHAEMRVRAERAEAELRMLRSIVAGTPGLEIIAERNAIKAERDRLREALEEIVETHGFYSVATARRALEEK